MNQLLYAMSLTAVAFFALGLFVGLAIVGGVK